MKDEKIVTGWPVIAVLKEGSTLEVVGNFFRLKLEDGILKSLSFPQGIWERCKKTFNEVIYSTYRILEPEKPELKPEVFIAPELLSKWREKGNHNKKGAITDLDDDDGTTICIRGYWISLNKFYKVWEPLPESRIRVIKKDFETLRKEVMKSFNGLMLYEVTEFLERLVEWNKEAGRKSAKQAETEKEISICETCRRMVETEYCAYGLYQKDNKCGKYCKR